MWLQGAGPVLWSMSMSLAPSQAFAGHPPSHQEASVVRRAAVPRAPASTVGTQQMLFLVLAEARCPWISSAVSCGCPGGGSRVSLFSGPYLTPGSSCEVQQSPFSSLGTLVGGLLLDRAGVGVFPEPSPADCLWSLCLHLGGLRGPLLCALLSLLHLRQLELCLPSPLPAPLNSFLLSRTRRPPRPTLGAPCPSPVVV